MRIACGGIQHETNTFASQPTTLADFQRDSQCGDDFAPGEVIERLYTNTGTIQGGFLQAAADEGIELISLLSAHAQPAGRVERTAYQRMMSLFLDRLQEVGTVDGVALDLHGAMATEDYEDAEGEIIAAVRQQIGPQIPLVVTLDLHANITQRMAEQADCLIGFDTYPHVDMRERGDEAVHTVARMVRQEIRPTQSYRQLPLLTMPPMQCTLREPMQSLVSELHALEQREDVITATLAMGFPFADIRDAGASVLVTTHDSPDLADQLADEFAGKLWELRDQLQPELTSIEDAMRFSRQQAEGLVIFADGSDNPGGGAPCDGTVALRALIESEFQNAAVGVLYDPETVELAHRTGVGVEAEFVVGGKTDDRHGEPVRLRGYVKTLGDGKYTFQGPMRHGCPGDFGRMAVLQVGGVQIVLASRRMQLLDAEMLRVVGVTPERCRLLVVKSAVHFRADLGPMASFIFDADTPGIHRPDFADFEYHAVRRPIYPLDPQVVFPRSS